MINLLLLLFFLTCIGVSASWLAENPGYVVIHWFGYRIDTSFAFLLMVAVATAFALAYVYVLLRHVSLAPEYYTKRRSLKQYQKGLSELTYSIAALAASDVKEAADHTRSAEKLLGTTPLTLLLQAQVARMQGNEDKTRLLLGQMLEHKETEYLAARSLCESANKQHLLPKALELAKRAHALNAKGIIPLLSLHLRLDEWQQAMHAINKSARKAKLTAAELKHYRGIVLLRQAEKALEGDHKRAALTAAQKALRLQPDFVPVIALAARAYAENGKKGKAVSLITHAWKRTPHEQLSAAFRSIIAKDSKEQQMKAARKLVAANPASNESDIVLGQVALQNRDWKTARQALTTALEKAETVRTCKLLAELESAEYPDFDISSKWIARSATASADPAWICSSCGKAAAQWDAHCPACEAFDTLEWKRRDLSYAA